MTACVSSFSAYYLYQKKHKQSYVHSNAFMETVEAIDHRFNDLKYKLLKSKHSEAPVVLLAIDDASVQEVGRWPWSRDLISSILEQLMASGVSTVGLDVIFSEPEKAYPENDQRLAEVVKNNSSKIVLGTFSNNELHFQPYQDFCVTEAFLKTGGDQIVKLDASLVVEDEGDSFDDVAWDQLFQPLFTTVSANVRESYLKENNKASEEGLNHFQRNHLKALTQAEWFKYCSVWLTNDDYLLNENKDKLMAVYADIFVEKLTKHGDNTQAKINDFKKSVLDFPSPQFGEWVPNIPSIQEPALMTGSFVAHLDVDGLIRRYPLFYRSGNRIGTSYIPSLSLNMYLAAKGYRAVVDVRQRKGHREIKAFKILDANDKLVHTLPTDIQGRVILNYYGPQNTLPYVSAKDLLNDSEMLTVSERVIDGDGHQFVVSKKQVNKKEYFKNRAVLVGATSMGIYDLRNTPVETNYPGPEIHLTMLANLFDNSFVKIVPREEVMMPAMIFALGILLSLLLAQLEAIKSMASFGFFLVAGGAIDYLVFSQYKIMYSSFFIFLLIGAVHSAAVVFKYLSEEKKKQELKRTFAKYVSPAVVDEILKAEENLKLGGKKQEMTVFFSDVRGFTKFSEKMDPEVLTEFLNEYLTPMTEVIFNNKGTLDKYMGDGLMAFFGAPIPYKDHAYSACQAALDSLERLQILKEDFKKKNWPDIDIGIGLNTGMMSVGNMGSQIVQSYTVIGDAVNLGSRLEGSTKQYGARILVSEATYNATKDSFLFREVDRVRVVGKKEPVGAFELLNSVKGSSRASYVDRYHEAYHYYVQRNFVKAMQSFEALEKEQPLDLLVRIYKKRCQDFIAEPPSEDWDGVYEMKSK